MSSISNVTRQGVDALRKLLHPESTGFPSQFGIGDPVEVRIQGQSIIGHVRAVTFTAGKVRYAVQAPVNADDPESLTTLHNLDSCVVFPGDGETIQYKMDNYS